jgi:hypothetical protein
VAGQAPQDVDDGGGQALGVVEDEQRVHAVLLLVAGQVALRGVEQVDALGGAIRKVFENLDDVPVTSAA